MSRLARVLGTRLAWAAAAVVVAAVVLMLAFTEWRDTGYGNTGHYSGRSDAALWGEAFTSAAHNVGITLLAHVVLTLFFSYESPIGRWAYWLTFFPAAALTTLITRSALQPVSDAGFAALALPLAWILTLSCIIAGGLELAAQAPRPQLVSPPLPSSAQASLPPLFPWDSPSFQPGPSLGERGTEAGEPADGA